MGDMCNPVMSLLQVKAEQQLELSQRALEAGMSAHVPPTAGAAGAPSRLQQQALCVGWERRKQDGLNHPDL